MYVISDIQKTFASKWFHHWYIQGKKSNWPPFLTIYDVTLPGGTGFCWTERMFKALQDSCARHLILNKWLWINLRGGRLLKVRSIHIYGLIIVTLSSNWQKIWWNYSWKRLQEELSNLLGASYCFRVHLFLMDIASKFTFAVYINFGCLKKLKLLHWAI